MTVKLTWTPGTGATSQTVQYRLQGSTTWTTYTTYNNNSTSSSQLVLDDGDYDFRILNSCTECGCTNGLTPDSQGNCFGFANTQPATQNSNTITLTRTPSTVFGGEGTRVYNTIPTAGDLNNTNNYVLLNPSNAFWKSNNLVTGPVNRLSVWGLRLDRFGQPINNFNIPNWSGIGTTSNGTTITVDSTATMLTGMIMSTLGIVPNTSPPESIQNVFGPDTTITQIISSTEFVVSNAPLKPIGNLTISAYLSGVPPVNDWIGFNVCVNIPTSKTYHIAIAADNAYRFYLDNVLRLSDLRGTTEVFTYLYMYPLQIPAGIHTLRLEAINNGSLAGFACEIFDLTNLPNGQTIVQYLNSQTTINTNPVTNQVTYGSDLESRVVFTTRNQTTFTSNLFTCPTNYNPVYLDCNNVICAQTPTSTPCTQVPKSSNVVSVQSPAPTYYYYTGLLCNGSVQESFRTTVPIPEGKIVRALCASCGNTEQCFDNVSSTNTPNSNDVINYFDTCEDCGNNSNGNITWDCIDGNCIQAINGAYPDYDSCYQDCGLN